MKQNRSKWLLLALAIVVVVLGFSSIFNDETNETSSAVPERIKDGILSVENLGGTYQLYTSNDLMLFPENTITGYKLYGSSDKVHYYNLMFALGYYVLVETDEGKIGLFVEDKYTAYGWVNYRDFGPYEDFLPGCRGFMYKINGKWGAQKCRYRHTDRNAPSVLVGDSRTVLEPEYDQVIEFYNTLRNNSYAWFGRKGSSWFGVSQDGRRINVSKNLINEILSIPVQDVLSSQPSMVGAQRVGTEEASVVFMGKSSI